MGSRYFWRSTLCLLVLLTGLGLIYLIRGGSSPSMSGDTRSQADNSAGPPLTIGTYIQSDHGTYQGGLKSVGANSDLIKGSQNRFGWRSLEPSPGQYDWTKIDSWLSQLASGNKKGVIGVMLRCEDGDSGDICAPSWAVSDEYDPVLVDATQIPAKCGISAGDSRLKRLNYLNPAVKQRLSAFITALGQRYRDHATVAHIELDIGYWGEANPHSGSNTICDKNAQQSAYQNKYSSAEWVGFANWMVDQYVTAFDNKKPISVMTNGLLHSHYERVDRVTHILQKAKTGIRLGMHNSGLESDFPLGTKVDGKSAQDLPADDARAYTSQWVPMERLWSDVYASFEFNYIGARSHYNLPGIPNDRAFIWWSILNALDKHASVLYIYSDNYNSQNSSWNTASPRWEWRNQDALKFFDQFAGKTPTTTDQAWIAFRTSMVKAPPDESNPMFYFGDIGDYEFFITHLLGAEGNSQLGHYAAEKNHGGSNPPWDNNPGDWRGAYNRQTDLEHGRPFLTLDIGDQFMTTPPGSVEVTVSYWDGTSDMSGRTWRLEYDAVSAPTASAGEVTLGGSNTFLDKTFVLSDASFTNRLAGGDLRLRATSGDTFFHSVMVQKSDNSGCQKSYDLNGDGKLNLRDYSAWSAGLSQTGDNLPADFNCDNKVNLLDYELLLSRLKVE